MHSRIVTALVALPLVMTLALWTLPERAGGGACEESHTHYTFGNVYGQTCGQSPETWTCALYVYRISAYSCLSVHAATECWTLNPMPKEERLFFQCGATFDQCEERGTWVVWVQSEGRITVPVETCD